MNSRPHSVVVLLLIVLLFAGCASAPHGAPAADILTTRMEAAAALNAGDLPTALVSLRSLQARGDTSVETLKLTARLHTQTGDAEALYRVNEQIIAQDPSELQSLTLLGIAAVRRGELAIAAEYLQRAVVVDPRHWPAHNGLGVIADKEHRFADAERHFKRALEILPGHPRLIGNMGWSKLLSGQLEEAQALLEQALLLAPEEKITRSNLALSLALQGHYERARSLYTELYGEAAAANNLGYAAMVRGDDAAAAAFLRDAIHARASFYTRAANNLARVEKNCLNRNDGRGCSEQSLELGQQFFLE
jgi:Flp pilus assembly protein TadD